ncbi:MAG: rod shape-determining protein MreD [Omnitrophica WOR_2 bacterium RIFCSPHIGHO2_01_FULL_48_9]|nr:MAG: rod shape-determining protein MreD [Omnitrophica WOR_2 bacterium RIFCSPHIGHO2_02_FULL_48_11]OGX31185.1 MAG: rod shape-determining protein MreD [Omnitrophica WOR_2 bacterium RIFCSPHIGHO2_01_FULL_48_9]
MRKIFFIIVLSFLAIVSEFVLFNFFGSWLKPNFAIILIAFFNLAWGIRYGIIAALVCGVLKDSLSASFFGLNVFSFIVSVYLVTFIRRYFYYLGTRSSRARIIFMVCVVNVLVQYIIHVALSTADFWPMVKSILLPEVVATMLVCSYLLKYLKNWAVQFHS